MSSSARIFIVLFAAALAVVIAYCALTGDRAEKPGEVASTPVEAPAAAPTPTLQDQLSERLKGTTLATSDEVVRDLGSSLSDHPRLVTWLANSDLVRRFVASVNNVAEGKSPRVHLEFLQPEEKFRVRKLGAALVIDERSYERYDLVVEVFQSLDSERLGRLFVELEPLFEQAHREIAPPDRSFRETLSRAIDHLLATPDISASEVVEPKIVTYVYRDPTLEGLSEAQRQLLRLGPENVTKVREKLGELRRALGV